MTASKVDRADLARRADDDFKFMVLCESKRNMGMYRLLRDTSVEVDQARVKQEDAEAADALLKALAQSKVLDEQYASACGPAEGYDRDLRALVAAANAYLETQTPLRDQPELIALADAVTAFEPWLEGDSEDPRENGWVDDKGRP